MPASSIPKSSGSGGTDRGGWVSLSYGKGGNVQTMTVHAQRVDASAGSCTDSSGADPGP